MSKYLTILASIWNESNTKNLLAFVNNKKWSHLNEFLTQDMLHQQHENGKKMIDVFKTNGLVAVYRPEKTMSRINKRRDDTKPYNAFGLHNDIIAYRIDAELSYIYPTAKKVCDVITDMKGLTFNLANIEAKGVFYDIVSDIYAYVPNIGMMEIQIAHPVVGAMDAHDNKIRDMKERGEDTSNLISMRDALPGETYERIYDGVKDSILKNKTFNDNCHW
jgi:hypothetical protein